MYSVTFTLSGFSIVRREGIELRGTFTATIDANLRVGNVSETVTVTGETPLVDTQSATQQRVLGSEVVDAIPTSRMPSSLVELIPGITVTQGAGNWYGLGGHDVGGSVGDIVGIFAIHGGTFQDSRMMINGLSTGWGNEAFETGYTPNMSAIQETSLTRPHQSRTKWAAFARTSSRKTAATSSPGPSTAAIRTSISPPTMSTTTCARADCPSRTR
jgi:hypothetical protein